MLQINWYSLLKNETPDNGGGLGTRLATSPRGKNLAEITLIRKNHLNRFGLIGRRKRQLFPISQAFTLILTLNPFKIQHMMVNSKILSDVPMYLVSLK